MQNENSPWWEIDSKKDKAYFISKVTERADKLFDNLKEFRADATRYFQAVEYKDYSGNAEHKTLQDITNEDTFISNPYLTLNVTASCVETACNKIAKAKPKITFLTKGANRERREIANRLDKWVLTVFKKGSIWKLASRGFKSACICGLGIMKVVIKDSKIKFHKIAVFDFFCDNAMTGDNEPTEAGEIKFLPYYEIIKLFPAVEKEILELHGTDKNIKVYEIYKENIKQVITTDKVSISEVTWDKPLPYKFLRWEVADQGVISIGISKKLNAISQAITYIMKNTFTSIRNFAKARIFVPANSNPKAKNIANITAQIIEVNTEEGKLPVFSTPKAVDNQILEILIMLWQKAFEILGVSELSAGGKIPRGLEKASGAALRSYQNIESERFQLIRADYENFYIEITKLIFKLIPDSLLPKGVMRKDIEEMKEDCTIWTSSLLPETPSGRLAMVSDLFNTGLVTGSQAIDLLDSPDITRYAKSETARIKAIDILIDRALEKNSVPVFHPPLGLENTLDRARKKYAGLLIEEPDSLDKLTTLSQFVKELEDEAKKVTNTINALNAMNNAGTQGGGVPPPPNTPTGEMAGKAENY